MSGENFSYLSKAGAEISMHKIAETELPWRKYRTPYRIFLAEMLLVRTRTDVVADHFERIASRYPTIETLAFADETELREMLRPLGLSKRVPYLIKAARYICENHNGEIPADFESLLKVPGIGAYTAAAILTFGYGQGLVPADVNILRFVSRFTGLKMGHPTKGSQELRDLLPLLSEANVGLSAENLLDFTRLICKARKPKCHICPLSEHCSYFKNTLLEQETA
jgi:A/G-specific adenine glycosylase